MKEATWKIFLIKEDVGDIYVEFTCDNKYTRKFYKWNNNKDFLLQNIREDAINFAKNCLESPIDLDTKQQLISLTGTSIDESIDTQNFGSFIK